MILSYHYCRYNVIIIISLLQVQCYPYVIIAGAFLVGSGEWTVTKVDSKLYESLFRCCEYPFSTITLELHLTRMARYYVIYILLPLSALVLVFALVFHLDVGQRASYGVTILLSITVYLLVISDKLPEKSDEFPFIGISFIVDFCILCAFLPCAQYAAQMPFRSDPPPVWIVMMVRMFSTTYKVEMYDTVSAAIEQSYELSDSDEKNLSAKSKSELYQDGWKKCARFLDKFLTFVYLLIQSLFLLTYLIVGYQMSFAKA